MGKIVFIGDGITKGTDYCGVRADTTNDVALFSATCAAAATNTHSFSFMYTVI